MAPGDLAAVTESVTTPFPLQDPTLPRYGLVPVYPRSPKVQRSRCWGKEGRFSHAPW